jgi:hypothetical protein
MKTNLLKTNLLILALLLVSSGLMAQDPTHIWVTNNTGDWEDVTNWIGTPGGLPGTADLGRAIFRGGTATISTNQTGSFRLELGDNKNANTNELTIKDGGHLGAMRPTGSHSEVGIWSPAKLTIEEGGSMTTSGHFWLGTTKNYSTRADGTTVDVINPEANMKSEVHLNGGTLTVGQMFGIDFYNNKESSGGIFYMKGGLLDLAQWNPGTTPGSPNASIGKNGKIEYTAGLIRIKGNFKESLESFRDDGKITGEFEIWVEETKTMVDDGAGGQTELITYVTKLSNEGPKELATDATLSNLTLSIGTLSPVFDAATKSYSVTLPAGTTTVPTVTATTTDAKATVIVTNATDVTSVDAAARTTQIEITAEDGVTKLTYDIVFNVLGTSVADLNLDKLNIYPNPASSMLYISHAAKIDRIEIFNIAGSKVYSQMNINDAIDVSGLKAGLYFISVLDANNNNIVRRFIKQ